MPKGGSGASRPWALLQTYDLLNGLLTPQAQPPDPPAQHVATLNNAKK